MISAVDILSDEVAHHAADEDIRGKMLAPMNPREVHQGGESVDHDFDIRAGKLVCYNSGYGRRQRSMLRGKRCAILKERPGAVALVRQFTPKWIFERLNHYQAIKGGLAGQKSGFAPVFVVLDMAQKPHSARSPDKGSDPGIRNRCVVANRSRVVRKTLAVACVCHEEAGGNPA